VIKSQDDGRAEAVYAGFVQQTAQLAEVEIRRTQLQAQKAFIEDVIALSEDRAKRLQADLDVARTQQAKVNDYQRQTQTEAVALRAEKEKAQAQLREVQNQVLQDGVGAAGTAISRLQSSSWHQADSGRRPGNLPGRLLMRDCPTGTRSAAR
jgi:chromosome segregation ATPase